MCREAATLGSQMADGSALGALLSLRGPSCGSCGTGSGPTFPPGGLAWQGSHLTASTAPRGGSSSRDFNFHMFVFFLFFFFLGPLPQHMEVPSLGVQSELQLPVYTTATATWDPSHVCDPHHSSRPCWILNPLSEARDQTWSLMDTSQVCYPRAATGAPGRVFLLPSHERCFVVSNCPLAFLPPGRLGPQVVPASAPL